LIGNYILKRRRKWVEFEERIKRLKMQLERGQRDVYSYWDAIKYAVKQAA
jgi:hypothetical protein